MLNENSAQIEGLGREPRPFYKEDTEVQKQNEWRSPLITTVQFKTAMIPLFAQNNYKERMYLRSERAKVFINDLLYDHSYE